MGILDLLKNSLVKKPFAGIIKKCPNCEANVDLGWDAVKKNNLMSLTFLTSLSYATRQLYYE